MAKTGMSKGRPMSATLKVAGSPIGKIAPTAPADLRDAGRDFWQQVFTFATWLDANLDGYLVAQAARLADDMADARTEISKSGRYQSIPNGSLTRSAAVVDLEKLTQTQNAYLAALGLTPSDRARLGLAALEPDSELTELARRRLEREQARQQGTK